MDAVPLCLGDGVGGIFTRRIEQGQDAHETPSTVVSRAGHRQRALAFPGQLVDDLFRPGAILGGEPGQIHYDLGGALGCLERPVFFIPKGRFGALIHRIEGDEGKGFVGGQPLGHVDTLEDCGINAVIVLGFGGQGGGEDQFFFIGSFK